VRRLCRPRYSAARPLVVEVSGGVVHGLSVTHVPSGEIRVGTARDDLILQVQSVSLQLHASALCQGLHGSGSALSRIRVLELDVAVLLHHALDGSACAVVRVRLLLHHVGELVGEGVAAGGGGGAVLGAPGEDVLAAGGRAWAQLAGWGGG